MPESIASEIQKLEPSAIITLFVLDATNVGGSVFNFHAGTNQLNGNVIWQGVEYQRFPVEASGFDKNGGGQLPRPKFRASNYLSSISALLIEYGDLLGAKVTRKRTLMKYLDAVNFVGGVNPTADPTASFPDDIYFIDQKTAENRDVVEFELAAAIDLAGVQLPRRQVVQNVCPWIYRGSDCGYTGTAMYDANDKATTNSANDKCGKRLASCKARFGSGELPFGGFPGADLY
jgi:lambda family phage minor tail protein L